MNSLLPLDMKNELGHFVHKEKYSQVLNELLARTSFITYYLDNVYSLTYEKTMCIAANELDDWYWTFRDMSSTPTSDVQKVVLFRRVAGNLCFVYYSHSLKRLREEMKISDI
jgi:hypothetical protein